MPLTKLLLENIIDETKFIVKRKINNPLTKKDMEYNEKVPFIYNEFYNQYPKQLFDNMEEYIYENVREEVRDLIDYTKMTSFSEGEFLHVEKHKGTIHVVCFYFFEPKNIDSKTSSLTLNDFASYNLRISNHPPNADRIPSKINPEQNFNYYINEFTSQQEKEKQLREYVDEVIDYFNLIWEFRYSNSTVTEESKKRLIELNNKRNVDTINYSGWRTKQANLLTKLSKKFKNRKSQKKWNKKSKSQKTNFPEIIINF